MLRKQGRDELAEIVEVLEGIGKVLMSIDARLEEAVNLLGGGDEEADT